MTQILAPGFGLVGVYQRDEIRHFPDRIISACRTWPTDDERNDRQNWRDN
jgi:hypothetical protein